MNVLAKDQWDSASIEAQFHKRITFLTRRQQGYIMGAFREVLQSLQVVDTVDDPEEVCPKCGGQTFHGRCRCGR